MAGGKSYMIPGMLLPAMRLLLVLVAVGVGLVLTVIYFMAIILVRPRRMSDGRAVYYLHRLSPGDLQLAYEKMTFDVEDRRKPGSLLRIAAWWIPHPQPGDRCAVLIHGYADAKVGAIAWAPTLRGLGLNLLAIDLRAHGESGGRWCTGGYFERYDVSQVIDQLQRARPEQTRHIVLFGVSLGAAVAVATADIRSDIDAVILECPFTGFAEAAMSHARAWGMPGPFFQHRSLSLAQRLARADFSAVRPVDLIGRLRCPVMVIQSGADTFIGSDQIAAIRAAVESRPAALGASVYWCPEGAEHVQSICLDPEAYANHVGEFLWPPDASFGE